MEDKAEQGEARTTMAQFWKVSGGLDHRFTQRSDSDMAKLVIKFFHPKRRWGARSTCSQRLHSMKRHPANAEECVNAGELDFQSLNSKVGKEPSDMMITDFFYLFLQKQQPVQRNIPVGYFPSWTPSYCCFCKNK
jgi:hypothetical protein